MKETPSHRRAALFAEPLLMPRTVWEQVSSDLPAAPAALACLKAEADRWLGLEPLTVTAKQTPPPRQLFAARTALFTNTLITPPQARRSK